MVRGGRSNHSIKIAFTVKNTRPLSIFICLQSVFSSRLLDDVFVVGSFVSINHFDYLDIGSMYSQVPYRTQYTECDKLINIFMLYAIAIVIRRTHSLSGRAASVWFMLN